MCKQRLEAQGKAHTCPPLPPRRQKLHAASDFVDSQFIAEFVDECKVLCAIRHDNVNKIIGACCTLPNIACVLERAKGDLRELIDTEGLQGLSWSSRLSLGIGCCRGLAHLHSLEILHRVGAARRLPHCRGQDAVPGSATRPPPTLPATS